MHHLRLSSAILALIGFAGASRADDEGAAKTKELLVGKWTLPTVKGVVLEFTKDGSITYTTGRKGFKTWKGTYEVVDKNTIEVQYKEGQKPFPKQKKKVMIEAAKDSLKFDQNLDSDKPNPNAAPWVKAAD